MQSWRDRHPPSIAVGRCCWVCGKVGGQGFTSALRLAGYRMAPGEMGYAHPRCMARAKLQMPLHIAAIYHGDIDGDFNY